MIHSTDFNTQRLAQDALEGHGVSGGRPQLELRIAGRSHLQQTIVAAVVQLDARDRLRMTAIEALRETENGRERPDRPSLPAAEDAEAVVPLFRCRLAMVAGDERDGFDLLRLEASEIAVLDQVVRMFVVPLVADVDADVVQQRRVFEPLALAIGQSVSAPRLIEERDRDTRDLLGVLGPVVAALGQFDDAALADVGVAIGLRDLLAVTRDVIEHQPFAQGEIAESQIGRPKALEDRVQQNRAGDREVCPPGLEAGLAQPLLKIDGHEGLPDPMDLLRGNASVSERLAGPPSLLGARDGAETQDGAGRADDAIEAGRRDLIEVAADFGVDELPQLPFVARRQGIALDESFRQPENAELEAPRRVRRGAGATRDFHAAAPDVDDHGDVARDADPVDRGHMDETRFRGAGDHLGPNPRLVGDDAQELAAVFGFAHGARRGRDDLLHTVRFGETPELGQHLARRVHRLGSQGAAVQPTRPEADHLLFAIDDLERQIGADLHDDHVQ
jgi:hypothetical protein